jgi:calcineurin-like phosphoesterase family protein
VLTAGTYGGPRNSLAAARLANQTGPRRWWTADLHLGHTKIIHYAGRPFLDASEMNEALVDAWNDMVRADDEVWVLGDVAPGRAPARIAANRG